MHPLGTCGYSHSGTRPPLPPLLLGSQIVSPWLFIGAARRAGNQRSRHVPVPIVCAIRHLSCGYECYSKRTELVIDSWSTELGMVNERFVLPGLAALKNRPERAALWILGSLASLKCWLRLFLLIRCDLFLVEVRSMSWHVNFSYFILRWTFHFNLIVVFLDRRGSVYVRVSWSTSLFWFLGVSNIFIDTTAVL